MRKVLFLDIDESGFVELVDCRQRHFIQASTMDKMVDNEEKKENVQLISCPVLSCRTPIRRTMRYHSVINKCLASVELAKSKMRETSYRENKNNREEGYSQV